jgi:hypothetical protein
VTSQDELNLGVNLKSLVNEKSDNKRDVSTNLKDIGSQGDSITSKKGTKASIRESGPACRACSKVLKMRQLYF